MVTRRNKKPNKRRYRKRLSPVKRILRGFKIGVMVGIGTVGVLSMSAGFIFLYDLVTQAEVFSAQKIEIEGIRRLSRANIFEQAKLKKGVNIFSVNLPRARKRLLGHPWIAEAKISRIPPDGLKIALKEHSPVALIRLDRTYIMNTEGEIFKPWTVSDPTQLPKIDGLEFEDLYVRGDDMSPPLKAIMDIIGLGKRKNSVLPNSKLSAIQVDRDSGITIYAYQNKTEIKLGYGGYPGKYKILSTVLSYLNRQSEFRAVRTIDLKKMNRIVVNPIRAGATGKDKKEV